MGCTEAQSSPLFGTADKFDSHRAILAVSKHTYILVQGFHSSESDEDNSMGIVPEGDESSDDQHDDEDDGDDDDEDDEEEEDDEEDVDDEEDEHAIGIEEVHFAHEDGPPHEPVESDEESEDEDPEDEDGGQVCSPGPAVMSYARSFGFPRLGGRVPLDGPER